MDPTIIEKPRPRLMMLLRVAKDKYCLIEEDGSIRYLKCGYCDLEYTCFIRFESVKIWNKKNRLRCCRIRLMF